MQLPQWPIHTEKSLEYLRQVLESPQWGGFHPMVAEFEQRFAAYQHCRQGIAMMNGTVTLETALQAADVGLGDEVIVPAISFVSTATAVTRVGAIPVFVDIEPGDFNISPKAIERAITPRTRAIIPVHLYGQMADMDPIMAIARHHDLYVIEDAAQAIGSADAAGRRACSIGHIGCLSFFPTKNLGAFGDAGACVTNDEKLAAKLLKLRVHGMEPKYYHELIGGNFRLDEIQAAVLNVKLPHLDSWSAARQRNAAFYDAAFARAGLAPKVTTPPPAPRGSRHIYNQYCIRAERRDELRAHLAAQGVGVEIYYPLPLHMQQCFAYLGHKPEDFPESLRASRESLALPIYPELTEAQLQYVVDSIRGFCKA